MDDTWWHHHDTNFQVLRSKEVCDDKLFDGDNTNGIAAFDFSDATAQVKGLLMLGLLLRIIGINTSIELHVP